jgi:hypothetical protein
MEEIWQPFFFVYHNPAAVKDFQRFFILKKQPCVF